MYTVWPLVEKDQQRSSVNAAPVRGVPMTADKGARGPSLTRMRGLMTGGVAPPFKERSATLRERIWAQARLASRSGWQ